MIYIYKRHNPKKSKFSVRRRIYIGRLSRWYKFDQIK